MKETIFEFYRQYAPNVHITDEEISKLEKFYQGDVNKFINDFKIQVTDPQNIQFDRVTAGTTTVGNAADLADVEEAPSANIENASSKDDENAMSYFEKLAQE